MIANAQGLIFTRLCPKIPMMPTTRDMAPRIVKISESAFIITVSL